MVDVLSSLTSASGFNIPQLADALANAAVAGARQDATAKQQRATDTISALGRLRASVATFNAGIAGLGRQTSLGWSATSSLSAEIVPAFVTGSTPKSVTAQVVVDQLARGQVMASAQQQSGATFGTGRLTDRKSVV